MVPPASAFPPEGHKFGREGDEFQLCKELGGGSQGRVYVCTRLFHGKEYAVKIVNTKAVELRDNTIANLRREIAIMRELHHPKIVNLLEAFWEGDMCFMVMDLAREGDLHGRLERGKGLGDEVTSRHTCFQLLEAIGYMHSHKVIHRDLKPENVLITRSLPGPPVVLMVKVADFGLSRVLKRVGEDSPGMTACGTLDFLAPEVITGKYDEKIDIWSLGVMLYIMLCGDFPFEIGGVQDLAPGKLRRQLRTDESWYLLSPEAQDFVRGLLVVDPRERPGVLSCVQHCWLQEDAKVAFGLSATTIASFSPESSPNSGLEAEDWGDGIRQVRRVSSPPPGASRFERQWRLLEAGAVRGAVRQIAGRVGNAVDMVELQLGDGTSQRFGGQGGWEQRSFPLHKNEVILAVSQETRQDLTYLGNSLAFYTSNTQIIELQGHDARNRARFYCPLGSQICGLQFTGSRLTGVFLDKVPRDGAPMAVEEISGRVGSSVDEVVLKLRSGEIRRYGGDGGKRVGPWTLEEDEFIVAVEQGRKNAYLGNSLAFCTSLGNVFDVRGVESNTVRRFIAPPGQQICGLRYEGSLLCGVSIVPWDCRKEKLAESIREHNVFG